MDEFIFYLCWWTRVRSYGRREKDQMFNCNCKLYWKFSTIGILGAVRASTFVILHSLKRVEGWECREGEDEVRIIISRLHQTNFSSITFANITIPPILQKRVNSSIFYFFKNARAELLSPCTQTLSWGRNIVSYFIFQRMINSTRWTWNMKHKDHSYRSFIMYKWKDGNKYLPRSHLSYNYLVFNQAQNCTNSPKPWKLLHSLIWGGGRILFVSYLPLASGEVIIWVLPWRITIEQCTNR